MINIRSISKRQHGGTLSIFTSHLYTANKNMSIRATPSPLSKRLTKIVSHHKTIRWLTTIQLKVLPFAEKQSKEIRIMIVMDVVVRSTTNNHTLPELCVRR